MSGPAIEIVARSAKLIVVTTKSIAKIVQRTLLGRSVAETMLDAGIVASPLGDMPRCAPG